MDRETLTLLIALVALGLGVLNSYTQWQTYRRSRLSVHVEVSWMGVPHGGTFVAVTATNTGGQPVGITSMSFETADGRTVPLMLTQPGCAMPATLQPGEHTAMWAESEELGRSLREERTRLVAAVVSGPGGRRWRLDRLGKIGELGQ